MWKKWIIDPIWFLGMSGASTNDLRENRFRNNLMRYACTISLHIITVLPWITASLIIANSKMNLSRLASQITYRWLIRSKRDADWWTSWLSFITRAFSCYMKCFFSDWSSSISSFCFGSDVEVKMQRYWGTKFSFKRSDVNSKACNNSTLSITILRHNIFTKRGYILTAREGVIIKTLDLRGVLFWSDFFNFSCASV